MTTPEIVGQIDIATCAQVISQSYQDYLIPISIALAISMVAFLIFALLWIQANKDEKLAKDYLRRRNALNDFETWKKDRDIRT